MGLGYLTLAIKSEQDKYLTGNPQFTFFKSVYRRHTSFAVDYQFVNFVGDSSNTFGKKIYIDIPKNGDLIHRMYLTVDISGTSGLKNIDPSGYSYIEYIDLYIGGRLIDRHYGEWLQLWHELNVDGNKELVLGKMISVQPEDSTQTIQKLYIPLRFWFNNDIGLSLPLIALQYNDIKMEVKFNDKDKLITYSKSTDTNGEEKNVTDSNLQINSIQLLTEYIHLDKEERRLFASNNHEYLITQIQTSLNNPIDLYKSDSREIFEKTTHRTFLRFNHPVKELIWTFKDNNGLIHRLGDNLSNFQNKGILSKNYWRNFNVGSEHMIGAQLVLNGKEMTEELPPTFFRHIQQYQYYDGFGIRSLKNDNTENNGPAKKYINYSLGSGAYSYSFCLYPNESSPSGTLNFSNLEQAQLKYRLFRPFNQTSNVTITAASSAAVDINNAPNTLDGVNLSNGNVVILKDQAINSQNGIYVYDNANNNFTRHSEFDTTTDLINYIGYSFNVKSGTTNLGKEFILNFKDTGVIDVDNVNFIDSGSFTLQSKSVTVYAVNYNILKIASGMGSVLFTN